MAALSTVVDTDGTGNYTGIQAMDTAEGQDLTDGGGDTFTATCEASSGGDDTTAIAITGTWVTSPDYDLTLIAKDGDQALVSGWDAARYLATTAGASPTIRITIANVNLSGLQLEHTGTVDVVSVDAAGITIDSCRIRGDGANDDGIGLAGALAANPSRVSNCIIEDHGDMGILSAADENSANFLYNNIVTRCTDRGIYTGNSDTIAVNNIVFDNGNDFDGTFATLSYNASDDNDGADNVAESSADQFWTSDLVDAQNGDYTILVGSALRATGLGPTADANVPTTDMLGNTRSGATADVGVAEYVAAGGSIVVLRRRRSSGGWM